MLFLEKMRRNIKRWHCKKFCPRRYMKGIVIVIPYDREKNRILLIKEFIHYYDRAFWKFVSGGIDKGGLSILEHAQEELAEELQMKSSRWIHYYTFQEFFRSKKVFVFFAENTQELEKQKKNPDHRLGNYILERRWLGIDELWKMIEANEIIPQESVLVALRFLREQEKKKLSV